MRMSEPNAVAWDVLLDTEYLYQLVVSPSAIDFKDFDPDTESRLMEVMGEMRAGASIDELGTELLPRAIDGDAMYAFWPDYWEKLKHEFKLLVCTSDSKYTEVRQRLASSADKTQATAVSTIAAVMGAQFGVVAGLIVPFVALCLIVLARLGKEAFCAVKNWDFPLAES